MANVDCGGGARNFASANATLEGSFGGDRTGFPLPLRSLYRVSNVVTVSTTEAHHFRNGQSVSISGSAGFADGTFTIAVTDPVHFTFAQVGADDHEFTGTVQTAAAPTYTIADCSEAVGYDGVNHTLTIQANSYTWANGDNLQSGPNVYAGGGIGSFAIQKYAPHTAFPGGGDECSSTRCARC